MQVTPAPFVRRLFNFCKIESDQEVPADLKEMLGSLFLIVLRQECHLLYKWYC